MEEIGVRAYLNVCDKVCAKLLYHLDLNEVQNLGCPAHLRFSHVHRSVHHRPSKFQGQSNLFSTRRNKATTTETYHQH